MASWIVSLLSVAAHITTIYMAWRLVKTTQNNIGWVLIFISISLMLLRRLEYLYLYVYGNGLMTTTYYEMLGLIISIIMLVGVCKVKPIFISIKTYHDQLIETISEKDMFLDELRQTKQLLEVVANGITEEILLITKDFKILWANNAIIRKHKCEQNKIIGMHCHKLTHHFDKPCEPPSEPCPIVDYEINRQSTVVKHVHVNEDGSNAFVEISAYPILDSDGEIDKFVHVAKDISERVKQEEEISNLNKILEQKVKEEVSLREQERQLLVQQSKMASIGEMIGMIAHQWRQPLNVISIIAQEIDDAYKTDEMTQEYMKKTIDIILGQIDFMSKTINDFRTLLNPSKTTTVFSVEESIENILFMFKTMLDKSNIVVTFCRDNIYDKYLLIGQPNEFKHVVLNLINNSKDAICSMWETNLLAKDIQGKINISLSKHDDKILIVHRDNGGGIPDNFIDKIFAPHFTTKPEEKGTGIGLYISKTIIEGMGGSLTVRNANEGAEFTIEFAASRV